MNIFLAVLIFLMSGPGIAVEAGNPIPDINKIQAAYEQVLKLNPRNTDALFMLGLIYEKKRQTQEALRIWRQYLTVETHPAERAVAEKHIHQLSQ